MLCVADLLSLPQFEAFRLITDSDGLHNPVEGASILEWETPREIVTDFAPNDFVITTLYMSRDNRGHADEGLKALIKHRVAALGLKTIYDKPCSQEVIDLANLYKIPIFTYQDTYMEDLIYTIKSAVFASNSNDIALDYLRFLMEGIDEKIVSTARKINPLFCDSLRCCCCIPVSPNHAEVLDKALSAYRKTLSVSLPASRSHDTFIRCNRCILIIHTSQEQLLMEDELLERAIKDFSLDADAFRIGFSRPKENLSLLREAIDESVSAAASALSKNEKWKAYGEIGVDSLLLPNIHTKTFEEFYKGFLRKLTAYDDKHTSNLINTLLCYIESEGDIALTAKKMFQHGNTIRYRLEKIKSILEINSNPDTYVQLYIFAQLHKFHRIFGSDPVI